MSINIKPKLKILKPVVKLEQSKDPDPVQDSKAEEEKETEKETETVTETVQDSGNISTVSTTETKVVRTPIADPKTLLLPYQIPHVESLIYSLNTYGRVLDASDTGTGKTYAAVAACMVLGLKPLIICPKSVLSSWRKALDHFGAHYYGLSNYESIQNCKYFTANSGNSKLICNFIEKVDLKGMKNTQSASESSNIPDDEEKANSEYDNSRHQRRSVPTNGHKSETFVGPTDGNPFVEDYRKSHVRAQSEISRSGIHGRLVDNPEKFPGRGYRSGFRNDRRNDRNPRNMRNDRYDHQNNRANRHDERQEPKKIFKKVEEGEEEMTRDYLYRWVNLPADICLIFDENS